MSMPRNESETRELLERMLRDMDSLLDHVTDPRNDRTREIAAQVSALLQTRAPQPAPQIIEARAIPVETVPAEYVQAPQQQQLEQAYRPSMAENGIVAQIVANIVPWEYQATVYNILGNIRVKTSHMALILVAGVIGGMATGYIPFPQTLKTAWSELWRDKCHVPTSQQPALHVPPVQIDPNQQPQYQYQQPIQR